MKCITVEGIPNQIIEFENEAYMRCRIPIQYNGKFGDITIAARYIFTVRSILYFMFLGIIKYKE